MKKILLNLKNFKKLNVLSSATDMRKSELVDYLITKEFHACGLKLIDNQEIIPEYEN